MTGNERTKPGCLADSGHESNAGAAWRGEPGHLKPSHILLTALLGRDLQLVCFLARSS